MAAKLKNKKNILDDIQEEKLFSLKICDLPVAIEGTWLWECVQQLYKELEDKRIAFKPVCYLADEWLTPEGETCIGIPFYLAHPALTKLEKKMMLEAEGETKAWCMKLLRHEAGHAICYAYRLNKKRKWKEIFGSSSKEYADTYKFRPYSKNYVRHLDGFYAQYHPDEDFVETFAVWLTPEINWQERYQGWKALKKLQYVDHIMQGIQGKEPSNKSAKKYWYFKKIKVALKKFYDKKTFLRAEDFPHFHDGNLKKIFSERDEESKGLSSAVDILRKYRQGIIKDIAVWTGEKKYVIHGVFKDIYKRCKALRLVAKEPEAHLVMRISVYITTLVMNYLYTGWYRGYKKKK